MKARLGVSRIEHSKKKEKAGGRKRLVLRGAWSRARRRAEPERSQGGGVDAAQMQGPNSGLGTPEDQGRVISRRGADYICIGGRMVY